jgi:hypothetical protein
MPVEGGLRDRFIFESFAAPLRAALDDLGWFDAGRKHKPVLFSTEAVGLSTPIPVNTIVVSTEDIDADPGELGSNLTEDRVIAWIDVYAEDDSIGRHLSGDIRDILRGKMPSISIEDPGFMVLDWEQPDPKPELFFVDVEDVMLDRSPNPTAQRHWFQVSCVLVEDRP